MNYKKSKKLLFIVILSICILAFFCGYIQNGKGTDVMYIEYGDAFEQYSAYSVNNKEIVLDNEGINVYFYLSETCDTCLDVLALYKQLSNIEFPDKIKFYCLWENDIPEGKIQKLKIDDSNILSLQGRYKFHSVKPYYFVVRDGEVDFTTQDYNEIIDRVLYYVDDMELLKKNIFKSCFDNEDILNTALVFMSGKLNNIQLEALNYEEIYLVADYRDEAVFYDEFGMYTKVFGIGVYPTVVFYDGFKFDNYVIEDSH